MRPIIPLESDDAIERTVPVPLDEISIAQGIREVRDLLRDLEFKTNDNVYEHSVIDL